MLTYFPNLDRLVLADVPDLLVCRRDACIEQTVFNVNQKIGKQTDCAQSC